MIQQLKKIFIDALGASMISDSFKEVNVVDAFTSFTVCSNDTGPSIRLSPSLALEGRDIRIDDTEFTLETAKHFIEEYKDTLNDLKVVSYIIADTQKGRSVALLSSCAPSVIKVLQEWQQKNIFTTDQIIFINRTIELTKDRPFEKLTHQIYRSLVESNSIISANMLESIISAIKSKDNTLASFEIRDVKSVTPIKKYNFTSTPPTIEFFDVQNAMSSQLINVDDVHNLKYLVRYLKDILDFNVSHNEEILDGILRSMVERVTYNVEFAQHRDIATSSNVINFFKDKEDISVYSSVDFGRYDIYNIEFVCIEIGHDWAYCFVYPLVDGESHCKYYDIIHSTNVFMNELLKDKLNELEHVNNVDELKLDYEVIELGSIDIDPNDFKLPFFNEHEYLLGDINGHYFLSDLVVNMVDQKIIVNKFEITKDM